MKNYLLFAFLFFAFAGFAQQPNKSQSGSPDVKEPKLLAQLEKAVAALDSALTISLKEADRIVNDSTELKKLKRSIVKLNKDAEKAGEKISKELEAIATDIEKELETDGK
jgi:hypothetical protein